MKFIFHSLTFSVFLAFFLSCAPKSEESVLKRTNQNQEDNILSESDIELILSMSGNSKEKIGLFIIELAMAKNMSSNELAKDIDKVILTECEQICTFKRKF